MSPRALASANGSLEWDHAAVPMPGEKALGDRPIVAFAGGRALIAAVDGLGHGADAAAAAQAATSVLMRSAGAEPAAALLDCHRALAQTRGAALSLASIDLRTHTMTWLGVGNVEARLLRGGTEPVPVTESLLLHGGIVGHQLPRLPAQTTTVGRGDVLIFATDGVRRDFADDLAPSGSCRAMAERILERSALGSDDALVLVARYLEKR
jgi:serine phosphatase RsbU (regulator of sigma subunit)